MNQGNRTVQVKLDEMTIATLKGILHQVEQQKAKRVRKDTTVEDQRQLEFLESQDKEKQD